MNLLDQAIACIGNDPVERLVVLSPYWDAKLEGLSRLKDALGGPPIDILISKSAEGFPSDQLRKLAGVQVFDVSANAAKRFLHAKLIIAQGANWDHVISGSMNCTYPALFGPAAGGNAEAAIYKRVPSGTALRALGLAEYSGARLEGEQLEQLAKEFVTRETAVVAVDGGTLILQSDRLVWTKPKKLNAEPSALRLLDKEGSQVAQFELDERHARSWNLDHAKSRPKVGELIFKNGIIAAPIQVVDLDHLAVNTLPSQRGRKKQLVDAIAETLYEDLALYEQLNQLEAIQEEEELAALARVPKTAPVRREEMARRYEVLSYEEFIRARTIANAQGKAFGTFLNSRQDRASNLISASLNRMIGLVGVDLKDIEEKDLQFQNSIDFRTTEPSSLDDEGAAIKLAPSPNQSNHSNKQGLATAKKLQEAVSAFERRCKAKQDQRITTSEIVRLRALLQVILSYAQPLVGSFSDSQVLPIYNPEGHDWPRLVGRLVRQHFGVSRALEFLSVEQDEAEQQRVIEYFALAVWATKAAHSAVLATPDAANLKRPIASLQQNLIEQVKVVLRHVDNDKYYFDQISTQLDLRFKNRLGLMRQT